MLLLCYRSAQNSDSARILEGLCRIWGGLSALEFFYNPGSWAAGPCWYVNGPLALRNASRCRSSRRLSANGAVTYQPRSKAWVTAVIFLQRAESPHHVFAPLSGSAKETVQLRGRQSVKREGHPKLPGDGALPKGYLTDTPSLPRSPVVMPTVPLLRDSVSVAFAAQLRIRWRPTRLRRCRGSGKICIPTEDRRNEPVNADSRLLRKNLGSIVQIPYVLAGIAIRQAKGTF